MAALRFLRAVFAPLWFGAGSLAADLRLRSLAHGGGAWRWILGLDLWRTVDLRSWISELWFRSKSKTHSLRFWLALDLGSLRAVLDLRSLAGRFGSWIFGARRWILGLDLWSAADLRSLIFSRALDLRSKILALVLRSWQGIFGTVRRILAADLRSCHARLDLRSSRKGLDLAPKISSSRIDPISAKILSRSIDPSPAKILARPRTFGFTRLAIFGALAAFGIFGALPLSAEVVQIPTVDLRINAPQTPTQLVQSLNIVVIITLLVLSPSLIMMMTSFTRLLIIFSFLRTALGTQQMPPNTILISMALILTFFIMEPAAKESYSAAILPYMQEKIGYEEAFDKAVAPFKTFMIKNTREKDLALFLRIRKQENIKDESEISLTTLLPAFMISELKTAFEIGFLLYLPFLVIDMVVSSVLMSMGMMMLPPVMISLPFKIILFVMVDGWNLVIKNLVESFK